MRKILKISYIYLKVINPQKKQVLMMAASLPMECHFLSLAQALTVFKPKLAAMSEY